MPSRELVCSPLLSLHPKEIVSYRQIPAKGFPAGRFSYPLFHAILEDDKIQEFKSTTVPCQYWWDNKWYDLTSFDDPAQGFYSSTPQSDTDVYAVWNFCRKIN